MIHKYAMALMCNRIQTRDALEGRTSCCDGPAWPTMVSSPATTTTDGRRHARLAVGSPLHRLACRRNDVWRRTGEDPRQLDRGAVRLDAAAAGKARTDEEQWQDLRL